MFQDELPLVPLTNEALELVSFYLFVEVWVEGVYMFFSPVGLTDPMFFLLGILNYLACIK